MVIAVSQLHEKMYYVYKKNFYLTNFLFLFLLTIGLGHCSEVVDECDAAGGPKSLPFQKHSNSGGGGYFQRFSSSRLSQRNRQPQEAPQRQICMDCKEMILQVVRAQSTARRLQMAKSLFQQQILANKT